MLSVLIVDDDKTTAATLKDALQEGGFRVSKAVTFEEARELIKEEHFDAAFVDVVLDGDARGRPLGLRVCELVRGRFPQCWITIYSRLVDEDKHFERDKFERAGADDVRGSSWVSWLRAAELNEYVQEGVRAKDREAEAKRPVHPTSTWRTQAALELLTLPTLRKIVRTALPEGDHDSVSALTGGYSGAVVFHVETARATSGKPPQNTILKVSRTSHPLDTEIVGAPELGAPLEFMAVRPSRSSDAAIDGWFFISSALVPDTAPLREVLTANSPDSPRVRILAQRVVSDVINQIVQHSNKPASSEVARSDIRLSYRMAVGIEDVLSELERCRPHLGDVGGAAVVAVRAFLETGTDQGWSLALNSPYFAFAHGDLHSENLLVGRNDNVFVIDFARSRRMPRLFDVCTLVVDIWLRVLDSEEFAEWRWERVSTWDERISKYPPFVPRLPQNASEQHEKEPWELFSVQLIEYVLDLKPRVTMNEFAQALLFQLLRFVRFSSLTMPKKLLAIRLAARLLKDLRVS